MAAGTPDTAATTVRVGSVGNTAPHTAPPTQEDAMTSTTLSTPQHTSPSRNGLLAAFGVVDAAVLTAIGTFWDLTGNDSAVASHSGRNYAVSLGPTDPAVSKAGS